MALRIALIGTGPTGIYSFRKLIEHEKPLHIELFEKNEQVGHGMPYSPKTTSKSMLANIASIEIPPLTSSYLSWLKKQSSEKLKTYGLSSQQLHERLFTPRALLGEYFHEQLLELIEEARSRGHLVEVHTNAQVADIRPEDGALELLIPGYPLPPRFDRVILATGHSFPERGEDSPHYFSSPWSRLQQTRVPPCRVGILGTSLSALDATLTVVEQHGRFEHQADGALSFRLQSPGLSVTLLSWTGTLPETDFYCPIPYQPLAVMTDAALLRIRSLSAKYEPLFALLKQELSAADPDYARFISLPRLSPEEFTEVYFSQRKKTDPFLWAEQNLRESEAHRALRHTVPWRYALLRMHEKVESFIEEFSQEERTRFERGLKRVFVDNYSAVPPESIRRLLALHRAGVLQIQALGYEYELKREQQLTLLRTAHQTHTFDVFIDARGQRALSLKELPFPTLQKALLPTAKLFPPIDSEFHLTAPLPYAGKLAFAALPYLLHNRPFLQGITACARMGESLAHRILQDAHEQHPSRSLHAAATFLPWPTSPALWSPSSNAHSSPSSVLRVRS